MGAYVYRVTAKRVRCSDGKEANVAVYAYKPSWNYFDGDKFNRKWHFNSGCVASDAMAARGNITDRIVISHEGDKPGTPIDRVYENVQRVGHFHDDYDLGQPDRFPRIANVVAVL